MIRNALCIGINDFPGTQDAQPTGAFIHFVLQVLADLAPGNSTSGYSRITLTWLPTKQAQLNPQIFGSTTAHDLEVFD